MFSAFITLLLTFPFLVHQMETAAVCSIHVSNTFWVPDLKKCESTDEYFSLHPYCIILSASVFCLLAYQRDSGWSLKCAHVGFGFELSKVFPSLIYSPSCWGLSHTRPVSNQSLSPDWLAAGCWRLPAVARWNWLQRVWRCWTEKLFAAVLVTSRRMVQVPWNRFYFYSANIRGDNSHLQVIYIGRKRQQPDVRSRILNSGLNREPMKGSHASF